MKFLSFTYLFNNAKSSFLRFPLVIISAIIGVVLSIILFEFNNQINNKLLFINLLLTSAIGVPLFFCVSIFNTKNNTLPKYRYLTYFVSFSFLGFIYLSLPSIEDTHNTSIPYIRYGVFNAIVHLLVSFVPFLKTKELNGFWNYNKALFLRLCTSLLYSLFIYAGLIIALLSIAKLFNIHIHNKLYFDLYIIVIGLFNTWFFISGIPKDLNKLEAITNYPNGLKIFTQYILLPLLVLYLFILYAYTGKIIALWDWPKGWVSYLISGISILGFFNILLMYPYGRIKGNEWIQKFSKFFYFILIPLIVVLFIAINIRISDYGITVKRYAIISLGIWISLVSIYFILKKDNIKFIPISLSIILLITSFGPWGMFSISENSQVQRLESILANHNILIDGKIKNEVIWVKDSLPQFYTTQKRTNNRILNDSLHNEVKSILDYLNHHHGFKQIRPWFTQNIDSMIGVQTTHKRSYYKNEANKYMRTVGLEYKKRYNRHNDWNNRSYHYGNNSKTNLIKTRGYDYSYAFSFYKNQTKEITTAKNNIVFTRNKNKLFFISNNDSISFDLAEIHKKLHKKYGKTSKNNIPKRELIYRKKSDEFILKLNIQHLNFNYKKGIFDLKNITGNLLIREKH